MTRKPPPPTEAETLTAIRDLLAARGFRVFRRNAGLMRATYKGKERVVRFSQKGMADLYGWHRRTGIHLEVEVKRKGREPDALQAGWLLSAWQDGCVAFFADSVEMAEARLDELGYV